MSSFNIKEASFGKDEVIRGDTIESKRTRIVQSIDRWLDFLENGKKQKPDGSKMVAPIWLSKQQGDKIHYRLKFGQRNLAIGPKGEERMTVPASTPVSEVFSYLKDQVLAGTYDKSILAITKLIRESYSK